MFLAYLFTIKGASASYRYGIKEASREPLCEKKEIMSVLLLAYAIVSENFVKY